MKLKSQTILILALTSADPLSPVVIILALAFLCEILLSGLLAIMAKRKTRKK